MQRDLGLTSAQVVQRLAQEDTAAKTERTARAALGDSFAGAWFDAASGKLVVHSTKPGSDVLVARSLRTLTGVKSQIDRIGDVPRDVTGWHVDVRQNDVVVNVVKGAKDTEAFLAKVKAIDPSVRVVEVAQRPRTFAEVMGGLPYYINDAWRCSIGFAVHGGFVTAGHCGGVGANTKNHDGEQLGRVEQSIFPDRDMGFVRTEDGVTLTPLVYGYDGYGYYVNGSQEAPIGASICRSGSTTGMRCNTVLAKDETVHYSQGAVYHMTKTNVCAEGGDSGGSWLSGNEAQGVTSGGWGNCSSGGETWFQPVNPILEQWGLTLVTP